MNSKITYPVNAVQILVWSHNFFSVSSVVDLILGCGASHGSFAFEDLEQVQISGVCEHRLDLIKLVFTDGGFIGNACHLLDYSPDQLVDGEYLAGVLHNINPLVSEAFQTRNVRGVRRTLIPNMERI